MASQQTKSHPGDEAMAHVLRHGLVLFQLFEKDSLVKVADVLQVSEYHSLFVLQRGREVPVFPHGLQETVHSQLQVLERDQV